MQYEEDVDTIVVANFFVNFLKSVESNILPSDDPRLLITDDNEQRLKIKSVKDSTRLIHTITGDPEAHLFNVDTSEDSEFINFCFAAADWARQTPNWNDSDWFLLKNYRKKSQIKAIHDATRLRMMKKPQYKRYPTETAFNDWRDDIVCWWNDFVDNGYTTKMPQVYLFGRSNVGKTSFIKDDLLSEC